jgi:hypothetical protein
MALQGICSRQGAFSPFAFFSQALLSFFSSGILMNVASSFTFQVEDVTKQQILWFSPALGSKAAGAASAISAIDTQDITNAAFFGFGLNERDDLLHMYVLALRLHLTLLRLSCFSPFLHDVLVSLPRSGCR